MDTHSSHLLIEYFDCPPEKLEDKALITKLMNQAAEASNVNVIKSVFHEFSPQGVTGVLIISESHLSIHTWPEHGYASVDFFTCGDGLPENAYEVLTKGLEAGRSEKIMVKRGLIHNDNAMKLSYHKNLAHHEKQN